MRRVSKSRENQLGGALIEVALIIALIAVIALPAVRPIGIGVKYAVCQYAHAADGTGLDPSLVFRWDDGRCDRDDDPLGQPYFR